MHTHRRSRSRVLGALALLVAGAAGLSACASGTATGTAGSSLPVVSGTPSGGITPGGPMLSPSPAPDATASGPATGAHPTPGRGIPVSGYSVRGTALTVYFYAGVCDKYGVTADQSQPGEVRVTVVVTHHAPTGQMCPMVITSQHATVDLGQPLGSRKVVDTANGHPVPQQTGGTYSGMETHGPVGQN